MPQTMEMPRSALSGRPAAEIAAEVFLSPRVVDQRAFEEFASALRELVDRAAAHAEPLREATDRAERTLTLIRESAARQQSRLDLALKALAALEERSSNVERMLARATELAQLVDRFGDQADHLMATKLSEFATRLQSQSQGAAGQIAVLEDRLARAEAELAAKVDRVVERLGLGNEKDELGVARVDLPGLVKRAEEAATLAEGATQRLDGVREAAEKQARRMGEMMDTALGVMEQIERRHEGLEGKLRESVGLCREADEALRTREEALRKLTETPLTELQGRVNEIVSTLRETIEHAERSCELGYQVLSRQLAAVSELRGLLSAVEPWKPLLLEGTANGELPRALEAVVAEVRARVARDMSALAGALGRMAAEAGRVMAETGPQGA